MCSVASNTSPRRVLPVHHGIDALRKAHAGLRVTNRATEKAKKFAAIEDMFNLQQSLRNGCITVHEFMEEVYKSKQMLPPSVS